MLFTHLAKQDSVFVANSLKKRTEWLKFALSTNIEQISHICNITKFNKVTILKHIFYGIVTVQQPKSLTFSDHKMNIFDVLDSSIVGFVLDVALESFKTQPFDAAGGIFAWNGYPLIPNMDREAMHLVWLNNHRLIPEECDQCKSLH